MKRRARPPRFDQRWHRQRRRKKRLGSVLRTFRASLALALVFGLLVVAQRLGLTGGETWVLRDGRVPVCGEGSRGAAMCAIDGDTLAAGPRRIRLTGYDAPETDGACEAERDRAREATAELSRWLSAQPFELSGGDGPRATNTAASSAVPAAWSAAPNASSDKVSSPTTCSSAGSRAKAAGAGTRPTGALEWNWRSAVGKQWRKEPAGCRMAQCANTPFPPHWRCSSPSSSRMASVCNLSLKLFLRVLCLNSCRPA